MNRRGLLIVAAVLVLAAVGVYWLSTKVERYTHQWDSGPELNVMFNPWHAAQVFLQRQQKDSHRSFNLHPVFDKLNPYDALVLDNSSAIVSPATREKLLEWINNGGHLIITAVEEWDFDMESADPLLDDFGVRLYSLEDDEEEYADEDYVEVEYDEEYEEYDAEGDDAQEETEYAAPATENSLSQSDAQSQQLNEEEDNDAAQSCTFITYDNLFQVHWDEEILQLEALGEYSLDDEYGEAQRSGNAWPNAVLQYQVGGGKLTVMMDTTIWDNDRIGDYDHAYFLWQLVKADDIVWFVSSNDSEDLLDKLWRTAPYLMTGILVLLVIWGWRRWVRFGPMIPEPSNEHRQLLEHIEAATRFDWNHDQAKAMVESLRNEIKAEVSRQHSLDFKGDQQKWLDLVARYSQLEAALVAQAMRQAIPEREHPWTELISQLQTIRNAL
ncbi:MAG: hypothetical protein CMK89_16785 [Pseudomonadales bacterium]|nr:hypothetical protein [Pseudomonadales bacterium]